VAARFCWKWMFGFVEPTLTSGFATKWKTRSKCSSSSFLRSVGFNRSPFMKVNFGLLSHCLMFCRVQLLRLSKTQKLAPRVISASTRALAANESSSAGH
jgi:hypothetical protein